MKRFIDLTLSFLGLIIVSPVFLLTTILIFFNDFQFPFYTPQRMGKNMKPFKMIKFRSMAVNSDKTGVSSTSSNDKRITRVGKIIRKFKIDELSQLINVFNGSMSLVGPRPQVIRHVIEEYSNVEKKLLCVKPGITDFSSIVFSDEGEILKNSNDPDLDYNRLIRPWKSKLGIYYVENRSIIIDFKLIFLTVFAIFSRKRALHYLSNMLQSYGAPTNLVEISKRDSKLKPSVPPGFPI